MPNAEQKVAAIEAFSWSDEEVIAVNEASLAADPWAHDAADLAHVKDVLRELKRRLSMLHLGLQGQTCCYCRMVLAGGGYFLIDREHILPKAQFSGLTWDPMNLSVSCKRCNMEFKKERTDFVVDPKTILEDFRNRERYLLVHPNFDTWTEHLRKRVEQDNEFLLVKYTVMPGSTKGAYTHDFFNLADLEIDTLDRAQGMEVLDEKEDGYRQTMNAADQPPNAPAVQP